MTLIERGGKGRTEVSADRHNPAVHIAIGKYVEPGTQVFTDKLITYCGLEEKYTHPVINHVYKYDRANYPTNTMENFRACLSAILTEHVFP